MSDDLFACFDDESINEAGDFQPISSPQLSKEIREGEILEESCAFGNRDDSCGVLSFRAGTEISLLTHVRNIISSKCNQSNECAESVLASIDQFCLSRHWMMHIGPEKGELIGIELQQAITKTIRSNLELESGSSRKSFVCVELGTYCGYSSILLSQILRKNLLKSIDVDFQLFSVEINPDFAKIAEEMIRIAECEDLISVILGSSNVGQILQRAISNFGFQKRTIDFLFIDHCKDCYLTDLKNLEESGLIKRHTTVVADNVVFAGIDDYLQYMQKLADGKIVRTETKETQLEYVGSDKDLDVNFLDGLEVTFYIQDPKNHKVLKV